MATQTDVQQLIQGLVPGSVNNGNPNTIYNAAAPSMNAQGQWSQAGMPQAATLAALQLPALASGGGGGVPVWAPPTTAGNTAVRDLLASLPDASNWVRPPTPAVPVAPTTPTNTMVGRPEPINFPQPVGPVGHEVGSPFGGGGYFGGMSGGTGGTGGGGMGGFGSLQDILYGTSNGPTNWLVDKIGLENNGKMDWQQMLDVISEPMIKGDIWKSDVNRFDSFEAAKGLIGKLGLPAELLAKMAEKGWLGETMKNWALKSDNIGYLNDIAKLYPQDMLGNQDLNLQTQNGWGVDNNFNLTGGINLNNGGFAGDGSSNWMNGGTGSIFGGGDGFGGGSSGWGGDMGGFGSIGGSGLFGGGGSDWGGFGGFGGGGGGSSGSSGGWTTDSTFSTPMLAT